MSVDTLPFYQKGVISGRANANEYKVLSVTGEGHLEVDIHNPLSAFGELSTITPHAIYQTDAVYGLNALQVLKTESGTGSVTASDSSFVLSTGATIYSVASAQSRRRARYRPGQGLRSRFTALFDTPVANGYQVAGIGHSEDGIYFGYNGLQFGILYVKRGKREVNYLTVTTKATTASNVTITLGGVAFTVPVTDATALTLNKTAYEISQFTYTGWRAEARGAVIAFIRNSAGPSGGAFSFAAGTTGSAAAFSGFVAGVAATDTWIYQSDWNGDKMDGTGSSLVTLDPQKYNVFSVSLQYLGAGTITFGIEHSGADQNNGKMTVVHQLRFPNTLTDTSFGTPIFPFTAAVYSYGSTTDMTMKVGSFAAFVEGPRQYTGNKVCVTNTITTVTSAAYHPVFTILNTRIFSSKSNQIVCYLETISAAIKHTQPVNIFIIRNTQDFKLGMTTQNFVQYSTLSPVYYDTLATAITITDNSQIQWVGCLGETGDLDHHFGNGMGDFTIQPGEMITFCAKAVTGTPAYVTMSAVIRDDN